MGLRKHNMAKKNKIDKKNISFAKLNSCPTSPRKMRLVADLIRGLKVEKALNVLKFSSKSASLVLEKLVFSAVSNWQNKNSEDSLSSLYIKSITVDSAGMLKRLRPAPQGRGHRIRKRSNHVTIVVENKKNNDIKVSE